MTAIMIDPSKVPVSDQPNNLIGSLGDDDQITVANFDLVNSIYVGYSRGISSTSNNTTEIPPLGSAVVQASRRTFAVCAPGKTASAQIMPGAVQWTPSPAQVAAQINALGLAKDTTLQTTNAQVAGISGQFVSESLYNIATTALPGGASPVFANPTPLVPVSLTGSGLNGAQVSFFSSYELALTAVCQNTAAAGIFTVLLTWYNDLADTIPVDQVKWQVPANTGSGVNIVAKGPMRGNYMAVQIAGNELVGVSTTYALKLTGSLRDALTDDWRADSVGFGANPSSAKAWTNQLMYSLAATVATTFTRDALLYSGHVKVFMENNSATGTLIASITSEFAPNPILWRGSVPQNGTGTNPVLLDLLFPRGPVNLLVSNSGASTSGFNVTMIADRS